jgi:hypothetical protein
MQVRQQGFEMMPSVPEWQVEQLASVEHEQVKDEQGRTWRSMADS